MTIFTRSRISNSSLARCFLEGETDPIADPVYALPGGLLDVDAVCAELGIDLDTEGATAKGARKKRSAGRAERHHPHPLLPHTRWPTAS